ncbi:MAG: mechanosensitive ion channel family protein [Pseudomonadota bacterium]|nr:mechanosensitive ion channel family protein [Pseudomonadota bacterium]
MMIPLRLVILLGLLLSPLAGLSAQEAAPTIRDVLEAGSRSEEVMEQFKDEGNSIREGETPLSTVLALHEASENRDWKKAAQFLDTRFLAEELTGQQPDELIRKLAIIWSQNRIIDFSSVSNTRDGHLDDGLPSYRDLLGNIPLDSNESIPIYLQRVPDNQGGRIWKISNATTRYIPDLWAVYGYNPLLIKLEEHLPDFNFLYLQNWQVIGLLVVMAGAAVLAFGLRWLLLWSIQFSERYRDNMHRLVAVPMPWFVFFKLTQLGVGELGLSVKARIYLNEAALGYIATVFLLLAAIEFFTALFLSRTANQRYWSGIIRPIRTILKIIAIIVVLVLWLTESGYDINTILAGLGIGSLALALAAQKTLENMIGAITLYIAQPIKPGDFCKVGDITGIIEEIGLRSTRIRRLDRSVAHVPNSSLVSISLENISENDRRRYSRTLFLALDSTPDQLRLVLQKIRELLASHPRLLDIAARARFETIERDAYIIAINGYVDSADYEVYLAVAEDLNLRILEILRDCAVQLAVPQQRLLIRQEADTGTDAAAEATARISELEQQNRLAFPDVTEAEKANLKGQLRYPARGHSQS